MLMLVLVLAGCSVWLELKILQKVPGLKKAVGRFALIGIFCSLALSYFLGVMFGASGIIIMMAGLLSTAIAEPVRRSFKQTQEMQAKIETAKYWKTNTEETYKYVLIALKWIGIVLMAPLWLPVWYHAKKKESINA